jgi:beta-lactamase class D
MVEEGIERYYVGFVQNDDQIIYFNMANFNTKVEDVIKRIDNIYKKYLDQGLI